MFAVSLSPSGPAGYCQPLLPYPLDRHAMYISSVMNYAPCRISRQFARAGDHCKAIQAAVDVHPNPDSAPLRVLRSHISALTSIFLIVVLYFKTRMPRQDGGRGIMPEVVAARSRRTLEGTTTIADIRTSRAAAQYCLMQSRIR